MNTLATVFRQFARRCRDVDLEVSLERQLQHSSTRLADWLAADASTPSQKIGKHEQLVELAAALAALPDDQREAIEMHHIQGMPLAQIAETLGRSKPSVAGLIFRGVTAVRKQLANDNSALIR
jgi:RNA polymerase sigma-70 factor (ECF subfamily)